MAENGSILLAIDTHPGEQMKTLPQGVPNRSPQAFVTKPAIRNNEEWRCGKMTADADQHLSCLCQFGLKRHHSAFAFGVILFRCNGFPGEVKTEI